MSSYHVDVDDCGLAASLSATLRTLHKERRLDREECVAVGNRGAERPAKALT